MERGNDTVSRNLYKFHLKEKDRTIEKLFEELEEKKKEVEEKDREIETLRSDVHALSNGGQSNTNNEKKVNNDNVDNRIESQETESNKIGESNYYINIKNTDGSINMDEVNKLEQIVKEKRKEVAELENQLTNSTNQIRSYKLIPEIKSNDIESNKSGVDKDVG